MEKTITEKVTKEIVMESILICDICKKTCSSNNIKERMESQEFIRIRHDCGYDSVFGDGTVVMIDICQNCFKEKLGSFIKIYKNGELWDNYGQRGRNDCI